MPLGDEYNDAIWERRGLMLGEQFRVAGPLDSEARGNWARVVQAASLHPVSTGDQKQVALKIMRDRHLNSSEVYKMFGREARILERFSDEISAVRLLATGVLRTPAPSDASAAMELCTDVDIFTSRLLSMQGDGWRPFLVLETTPFAHTLLCRLRQLRSKYTPHLNAIIPLWEAITITVQALELLDKCHQHQLYFIDHKPEHVVWHNDQLRFLDWNGGEWAQDMRPGSFPFGLAQTDVMNFIGYVAFPLFAGVQIDGRAVRTLYRGSPHPPPPTTLEDGALLSFYDADAWLDPALKKILSRPFWEAKSRYPSAKAMANELLDYLDKWASEGLFERLADVMNDIEAAQQKVRSAQAQMKRLTRITERPKNIELPITLEVNRVRKHLQTFANHQVLTVEEVE